MDKEKFARPPLQDVTIRIPKDLVNLFADDLRIVKWHEIIGVPVITRVVVQNPELLVQLEKNFDVILVPKQEQVMH